MSYSGVVCSITTTKHPNADRLQLGSCLGHTVVVGLDTCTGDIGVYFPPDGQLSEEYCTANGLMKAQGGYMEANRRVRAMKLRGVNSDGLWMPLDSLALAGYDAPPSLGIEIGEPICCRYETPATIRARQQVKQNKGCWIPEYLFPKHHATLRLDKCDERTLSAPCTRVYVTEKLHGTSHRLGHIKIPHTPSRWELFRAFLRGIPAPIHTMVEVQGTRNTVLDAKDRGWRWRYMSYLLAEDELVYGEIVGYEEDSTLVMKTADVAKVPELMDQFGPGMKFRYGCKPGENRFYIYRIVQHGLELTWEQMVRRCAQLGLELVPLLDVVETKSLEWLMEHCESWAELASRLDASHMMEGVVVRIESFEGIQVYKHKSFNFKQLEGHTKSDDTYVDMEEIV